MAIFYELKNKFFQKKSNILCFLNKIKDGF